MILNGLYQVSVFGDTTTSVKFSNTSPIYTESLTQFKNTLDPNYFDTTTRSYEISRYGIGHHYKTSNPEYFNGDIGLPSVAEMFSGNDIDMYDNKTFVDDSKILNPTLYNYFWLMNYSSTTNVRVLFSNGGLSEASPTQISGVRPTWYIKNMNIVGGSGTANDPYRLK